MILVPARSRVGRAGPRKAPRTDRSGFRVLRLFSVGIAAAAAVAVIGIASDAVAGGKRAVLELFTSQGCSSCPPADALIRKLAKDDDVLALSFNVDYWDYLGWKDTLARHENTERQQAYAARRGDRSIYTPQVVINGRDHAVGSDRGAIVRSVEKQARKHGSLTLDVDLEAAGDTIKVHLGDGAGKGAAQVWLVLYNETETVKIRRGENRGRTITYTNVVRAMVPIGRWKGAAETLEISRREVAAKADFDHCAVIVQRTKKGYPAEIIGASDQMPIEGS